jgi:ClpP class serine protease
VLRINSPGAADGTDLMYSELQHFGSARKPVVAIVPTGRLGRHYLACGADKIYARRRA